MLIKKDCERIEQHLRRLASAAKSNSSGRKGSAFVKFVQTAKKIAIRQSELRSWAEVEREISQFKAKNATLEDENSGLRERCEELYENLLRAEEQITKAADEKVEEVYADMKRLKKENAYLHGYLDKIKEQERFENKGKKNSGSEGKATASKATRTED